MVDEVVEIGLGDVGEVGDVEQVVPGDFSDAVFVTVTEDMDMAQLVRDAGGDTTQALYIPDKDQPGVGALYVKGVDQATLDAALEVAGPVPVTVKPKSAPQLIAELTARVDALEHALNNLLQQVDALTP